jgi:hypothetical protein
MWEMVLIRLHEILMIQKITGHCIFHALGFQPLCSALRLGAFA